LESNPIAPVSLKVEMYNLGRQTENRLLALQGDVAECKSVDEAANFTRWLSTSGILAMLEMFTTDGSLPVNGPPLRKLAEKILSDCGDLYRSGKATARYQASDIAAINHKLDLIAGRLAGLEFPPATSLPVQTGTAPPVALDGEAGGPT